jgi:tetratricopeptide (TPR) repeat protein
LGEKSIDLPIGKPLSSATASDSSDRNRWNNYGIALLANQQFKAAARAFDEVLRIDPNYVDGYTNRALADYSLLTEVKRDTPDGYGIFPVENANAAPQEFSNALAWLDKALALDKENARALYYQAVICRLQKRFRDAISIQEQVVKRYPRFRQGLHELGYCAYLVKQDNAAIDAFERTLSINPDDLAAHYYLSILYGRNGKSSQAQEHARLYAERKDDPLIWQSVKTFWRTDKDIGQEVVPFHEHQLKQLIH